MLLLPDLSRLHLDDARITEDIGQDAQLAGIRKAKPRKQKRSDLARLVQDEPWESDSEDEDWMVPEELQGLDRADAARGRVAPHRRSPEIAEEVRANRGEAAKLFALIQGKMLTMWKKMMEWYWCETVPERLTAEMREHLTAVWRSHRAAVQPILHKYVLDQASWTRTAYYSVRGEIHDAVMPESSFRQLFDDYVKLRGGTWFLSDFSKAATGHFAQVEWETHNKVLVAQALAEHAQLFSPLLDAVREFGFVSEDHAEFQVLWRIHPVRHNNSSNWHMDSNDFRMYGDESMGRAAVWTQTGERSVVTTSCLSIDPTQPTEHCGTRMLSGLPALSEKAVKGIVDEMWDAKDTLLSYKCGNRDKEKYFAVMFNRLVIDATDAAIAEYTAFPAMHNYTRTIQDRVEQQARVEKLLASAGVETIRARNGEIVTFNDHQYHASSTVPEGHVRLFFVMRGKNLDRLGKPLPFREDAQIVDRHGRPAKLSFQPI